MNDELSINLIDKFFYINLDERTDRKMHFLDQCDKERIPRDKIERFSAIRGSNHNFTKKEIELFSEVDYIVESFSLNVSFDVAKSIMGNHLSHIKIIELMKERNYNTIVIFQDDVILKKNFMKHILNIVNNIPEDAEIINIGMHKQAIYEYSEGLDLDNDDNISIEYLINDYVAKYGTYDKMTGYRCNPASLAYVVTKKGCENLFNYFETTKIKYATDWEYNLYLQKKNIFYGSRYILCTGNPVFGSDVFTKKTNDILSNMIDMNYYYTDKSQFFQIYETLFCNIKKSSRNVLNISHVNDKSHSSDSYLFSKYFDNAFIFTVTPASKELSHKIIKYEKRIKTIKNCSNFNKIIIDTFIQNKIYFDLIVCDGKNNYNEIYLEIINYHELMTNNGLLIVENITDDVLDMIIKEIPDELKKYMKIIKINNNNLFIIDKTKNVYDIIFMELFEYIRNKFNIIHNSIELKLFDFDEPLLISYENNMSQNTNAQLFKETLIKNNWKYLFIGEGNKWSGFFNKIVGYHDITKYLPKEKVIILSDSRDVLCCRSPTSFMNKIKNTTESNKIIISTELLLLGHLDWSEEEIEDKLKENPEYFWQGIPLNNYWNKINIIPNKKYVNSGLIIGKSEKIFELFNWMKNNNYRDDQLGLSHYINNFTDNVYLDYKSEILHTSTSLVSGGMLNSKIQGEDSPSISELLGYSSYFLHIPGISMSKGQKHLYDICSRIIKDYNCETILNEYSLFQTKEYYPKYSFLK
jgi:GR25 family glycosyltransferase involved in LPS biosynthesis